MKLKYKLALASTVLVLSASAALANSVHATPSNDSSTDSVTVNLTSFPISTFGYHANNSVQITGPSSASGNDSLAVQIYPGVLKKGYTGSPIMAMFTSTGGTCILQFRDGPSELLSMRNIVNCNKISIGPIVKDGPNQYHLDARYTG